MLLGGEQGEIYRQSKKQEEIPRGPFTLPAANENMIRVFAYLLKSRMLDYGVVCAFAEKKLIYESLEPSRDGSRQYGIPHCPSCGKEIKKQSVAMMGPGMEAGSTTTLFL